MSKGKKIILNVIYSIIGVILLAATLFLFLSPGIPVKKVAEDGSQLAYLALPNGDYTGDSALGFLNGTGTFTFDTGEIYEGEWKNNAMAGTGKLTSSAGIYEGEFAKSQRSGKGTFVWTDGNKYEGQWANDKLNGEGEITTTSGLTYKGTFQDNALFNGTISGTYNGNQVEFKVTDGATADKITVTFSDGVMYSGGFDGKHFSGEGKMTYPDIGTYSGEYEEDKRSGDGIFTWTDGVKYDGKWSNDMFNGYGTYSFDANTSITGTFVNGGLDGTYTYTNSDGDFKTTWENGTCTSIKAK